MVEFSGETYVEYDGEYDLNLNELSEEQKDDMFKALCKYYLNNRETTMPIVQILVVIGFDTEVTIEVEPPDRY